MQPRAVYLLFHGGGWVFGDARGLNDERLERMANELRVVVVVPDYRKAPEHPFPAPLDDCEAAAVWCETRARAHFGLDASAPLLIGGESAGANLCAATLLRRSAKAKRSVSFSAKTDPFTKKKLFVVADVCFADVFSPPPRRDTTTTDTTTTTTPSTNPAIPRSARSRTSS